MGDIIYVLSNQQGKLLARSTDKAKLTAYSVAQGGGHQIVPGHVLKQAEIAATLDLDAEELTQEG